MNKVEMDENCAAVARTMLAEQVRTTRTKPWRMRIGIPVAIAATLAGGGVAFAAMTDRGPFDWTHDDPHGIVAKDNTARLLLTTTGPVGHPMQLYVAENNRDGKCYSIVIKDLPDPDFPLAADCVTAAGTNSKINAGTVGVGDGGGTAIPLAPGADYLTLSNGTRTLRAPVVDGVSAVYLDRDFIGRRLTMTTYRASGEQIDQANVDYPDNRVLPPMAPPDQQATKIGGGVTPIE